MHFSVKKEDFLKTLQAVQNAIAQKNTLPILANLLLESSKSEVKITATDLDIGISSFVEIQPKEQGAITVPAKKLVDIIKELPGNEDVSVALKKNNMIHIDCRSIHCKIIGLPKDEFPQMPEFKTAETCVLPQKLLKEMLAETSFAVSRDETRYVLNGILMIVKKDALQIVATDGRRLAMSTRSIPGHKGAEKKAIVPTRAVHEMLKILGDEGDVKLYVSANQAYFDMGKTNLVSRLIEGEFPNFEDVIPKEKKEKAKIDRTKFLAAAKRASLFTNPDSLAIKLEFSKNRMTVSKNTPFIGEVKEETDISYGGKALSIGFNPAYVIDLLSSVRDAEVELELDDADKPAVVRKEDYVYIVLPMQLT